ncbi:MAG: hypothetical protein Q8L41_15490 [Anaerolineales bacterium]|nr:hypothetical protein [Anaerolineales bacterium]MDP2776364.1 hypothetical protein [Anaerolineales bacterium]
MFDNLRDETAPTSYYEEDEVKFESATETEVEMPFARRSSRLLGMTSIQRFVIAVMLLLAVCVIGALCLLVANKIGL